MWRKALRRVKVYYGLAEEEETEPGLRLLAPRLLRGAAELAWLAVAATAAVFVLEWSPEPWIVTAGAFAAVTFLLVTEGVELPEHGLAPAPAAGMWEPRESLLEASFVFVGRTVGVLLLVLGAEEESLFRIAGEFFVLGGLAGASAALLLEAWLVRRWERAHALRIAVRGHGDEQERLAVHPLSI